VRVLGIETSSVRGSVALVDGDRVVTHAFQDEPNRHGERLLPLVDGLLAEVGWKRGSIERVGVGIGPGNFTGLRVGIALATGLSLGLGAPAVGVGSLRAIAGGLGAEDQRLRVVVRDARRGDYFIAAYTADGVEVLAPVAIPQPTLKENLQRLLPSTPWVIVGTPFADLPCAETDLTLEPDARVVALAAQHLDPAAHPALPEYVRGPDVIRPNLPISPLTQPRS
jgi:tRNA threonylcarbamoyladenosine biosynthesis protein TsaB